MYSSTDTEQDILSRQILETASQLYLKYGYKKVTMDDISKAIGKSRSSIYYYYKNRDEVFQAVMGTLVVEIINEIETAMEGVSSIHDKIQMFCLTKIKSSEDRKSFFTAVEAGMNAQEKSQHSKFMGILHQRLMTAETALIKKVISENIENKKIPSVKQETQETVVFILLSSIRGIKREMALKNDFSNVKHTVNTLTSMIVNWLKS
nr:TetR/AcrR family transcriptional regulator [Pedobacter panaciterrae]